MKPRRGVLVTTLAFLALSFAPLSVSTSVGQTPAPPPASPSSSAPPASAAAPAFAGEPYVIEEWHEEARFENDGTGRIARTLRVRIQSDQGVTAWGQLMADYNSSNETLDPPEVSVHKADGSVIPVDTKSAQDVALPVEMVAPTYTGYRQRHISVPSLRPGDSLTFRVVRTIVTPLVPGHFWYEQDFGDAVILDARLTLDLPAGRDVRVKVRPGVEELTGAKAPASAAGRRVRTWRTMNLVSAAEKAKAERDEADGQGAMADREEAARTKLPAFRMSSFESWEQIARWYGGVVSAAAETDEAIKAKAEALTRGKETEEAKLSALYAFVSAEVRYVSLSLGLNQYQPHKASETLRNQYGDCKDKHTLFAALARAVGLSVQPVLIHHLTRLDPDVPSPSQFDHVISVVPAGPDTGAWTWLDTTPGVAPYRALMAPLRGQDALLAMTDLPAAVTPSAVSTPSGAPSASASSNAALARGLVRVPTRPAIEVSGDSETTGALDEQGKLDAKVTAIVRGDPEFIWRLMLRDVPKAQMGTIAEGMQKALWMGGKVSDLEAGDAAAPREGLRITYRLERENYVDRTKTESGMYVPFDRPVLPFAQERDWENRTTPRPFGGPIMNRNRGRIEIPAAFTVKLPSNIDVTRPFGRYLATYALEGRTLVLERVFSLSTTEIDPSQAQEYLAFTRAVHADLARTILLTMPARPSGAEAPTTAASGVPELQRAAWKAYQERRFTESFALYTKVIEAEPNKGSAWNDRGLVLLALNKPDEAEADFKRQIALNAFDANAHNNLGRAYWQQRKYDEAAASFRKQIEINPLDQWAHRNFGLMENERRRYAEALPWLEKAAGITPDDAYLRVSLGTAYLETKAFEQARASFDKAVELTPNPMIWNNVAYQMSLRDFELEKAQQYAESAVGALAIQMRLLTLDGLKVQHLAGVAAFASYWDTLGWILFRRGDVAQAEKYLHAAWLLDPRGELGEHLGALYEKQGRVREALEVYAGAASADARRRDEPRDRLVALVQRSTAEARALLGKAGASSQTVPTALIDMARDRLIARRMTRLPADALPATGTIAGVTGELFLLFDSANPAVGVKFVKETPALAAFAPALRAATYAIAWPSDAPTKLVRRAVLSCDAKRVCTVVLVPPNDVRAVD